VTGDAGSPANAVQPEAQIPLVGGIEILGSSLLVQLLVGSYVGLVSRSCVIGRGCEVTESQNRPLGRPGEVSPPRIFRHD
jgi:hypothetical protein